MQTYPVAVETALERGMPRIDIVGLPDAAVSESRDRVRAAMRNSGFFFPALLIVKLLDIKQLSTMSLYHKNFILIHHQSIYYKMKESILFYISTGTAAPS